MVKDAGRKRAIRARMRETGENYTTAARALAAAAPAVSRPRIDPQLLVPYPDELIRPADASENWRAVTVDELGWRVLPPDATPAQRARAESIWRAVTTDRPCRCSGDCEHGRVCGMDSCAGRLMHYDRLAASMLSVYGWCDLYACDTCDEEYEFEVELSQVPWGESTPAGFVEFDGVRRVSYYGYVDGDGWCGECGNLPCTCDEVWCEDCGADSHYQCSCEEDYVPA